MTAKRCPWSIAACVLPAVAVAAASACVVLGPTKSGDGHLVRTEDGHCVNLVPESVQHTVRACETATNYEVTVIGRKVVSEKRAFRAALREKLWQYLRSAGAVPDRLRHATVEIWIAAPLLNPADASFVAVISETTGAGNFSVRLPLEPDDWHVSDEGVSLLGKTSYPSKGAKRIGMIALQPRGHVTEARLATFLKGTGLAMRGDLVPVEPTVGAAWQPLTIRTRPFAESAVAQLLKMQDDAKDIVGRIEYLPAGEGEGAKALAFRFPFGG